MIHNYINGVWDGIKTKKIKGGVVYKMKVFGTKNKYEWVPLETAKLLGFCDNNDYLEERIGW